MEVEGKHSPEVFDQEGVYRRRRSVSPQRGKAISSQNTGGDVVGRTGHRGLHVNKVNEPLIAQEAVQRKP